VFRRRTGPFSSRARQDARMNAPSGGWAVTCPVCQRLLWGAAPEPCPSCGLPAAGQAALILTRIGTTLTELSRDRDALLATLRASAPYDPSAQYQPAAPPPPAAVPAFPVAPVAPVAPAAPAAPNPTAWRPGPPPAPGTQRPPRRRLSPQQVLLGLGAVLVVAAAIAFVAVAWTRLGVVFQAGVMLTVTGVLCGLSAWTARTGLRATEETLAAAGTALLVVDLTAARALGLFRLEDVGLREWTAASCAVVLTAGLVLGRLTRSTAVWPLAALLAAQPLPFLLLPDGWASGPAGVAAALALAMADLVAARRLRPVLARVAMVLAAACTALGVLGGLLVAASPDPADSWTATALLLLAGAAVPVLLRAPLPGPLPRPALVGAVAAAVCGLSLTASLETVGDPGAVLAAASGLALLTAAALLASHPAATALVGGGATMAVAGSALLLADGRLRPLAVLAVAATVPALLAAVRVPALRRAATAAALLAPAAAVLLARADGWLTAAVAGLLLALVAAVAFAVATRRAGQPEEWVAAAAGTVAGLAAGLTTGAVGAWGQVALQLSIAGAAAGGYAIVVRRPLVATLAVGDLVIASWIAVGGTGVQTPEAYTLPAAIGLLVLALPRLRTGDRSWAAEGAAAAVALVPSALVVVAEPSALRLVLVVGGAVALVVTGTLAHRQAPFVVGAGALLFVVVGRLAPYAPLLPRWITLATAGLVLLVLGATYERRRQQAREAVAWIAQMH